jgi:hypothetical protein
MHLDDMLLRSAFEGPVGDFASTRRLAEMVLGGISVSASMRAEGIVLSPDRFKKGPPDEGPPKIDLDRFNKLESYTLPAAQAHAPLPGGAGAAADARSRIRPNPSFWAQAKR